MTISRTLHKPNKNTTEDTSLKQPVTDSFCSSLWCVNYHM